MLQMYPAQVRGTAHGISAATGKVGSISIVVSASPSVGKACVPRLLSDPHPLACKAPEAEGMRTAFAPLLVAGWQSLIAALLRQLAACC